MKHLTFPFELKALDDNGGFSGYASTFGNVDQGGDVVVRGAFQNWLNTAKVNAKALPMLWYHDPRQPIGTYDPAAMKEDDHGLYVKGQFTDGVAKAGEVRALMKSGAVSGLSIGYRTVDAAYDKDLGVTKLNQLNLMEISPVTFPMNEMAGITDVKSVLSMINPRLLESELREAVKSLSSGDAVKVVAIVKGHLRRDVEEDEEAAARDENRALEGLQKALSDARAAFSA